MIRKSKIKNQKSKLHIKIQNALNNFAFWFVILILDFWILNLNCFAQPVTSNELINKAKDYDGKTVAYEGEVIGDIMKRKDFAWINVNDGENAIGIWSNAALVKDIVYTGSYKSAGDRIEVTGVFHRACIEHGGDLDIHALALRKTRAGRLIKEKLNPQKMQLVVLLLGILGLTWISSLLKRK